MQIKEFSLIVWIIALEAIGMAIGYYSKSDKDTWYKRLNRSSLTPPNYVFPIAWTILYGFIGACGWSIWQSDEATFPGLNELKVLYIIGLVLNWSWTPIFFNLHQTGIALLVMLSLDITVGWIIWKCDPMLSTVSLLFTPYILWLTFATYLNFYIWWHN